MTEVRTIPFGRPWITDAERDAVGRVLEGPILTHGPECDRFEEAFAAVLGPQAHCVTVSSCMAALHLSYVAFGIGPGDEVIVPAQTHAATAHAVEWVGATPVFVDCDPATGNVTAEAIEQSITAKTKALSVVHLVGIPCDMPDIIDLAERHGLKVVEDCALAVGGRYGGRHVGLFGDAGCFSFYPVKHLTTAEGGMFVSRHREVADRVRRLRAFGVDRAHAERAIPGTYDVPMLGLNYRMSEIHAAIGRAQVERLPEMLGRRKANFEVLASELGDVDGLRVLDADAPAAQSGHYCLSVVLEGSLAGRRDAVVRSLNAAGVGTSVHYPHPVPRLAYYRQKYAYEAARFPNAVEISDRSVSLPVGPHITLDDASYMARELRRIVEEEAV